MGSIDITAVFEYAQAVIKTMLPVMLIPGCLGMIFYLVNKYAPWLQPDTPETKPMDYEDAFYRVIHHNLEQQRSHDALLISLAIIGSMTVAGLMLGGVVCSRVRRKNDY